MRNEVWPIYGRNTVTGLPLQDSSSFLPAFYLSLSLSLLEDLSDFTDENGTVTFEVPARSYTVSVSAQNFLPDSQPITVGLGEEVDVYFTLNRDIPKEEGGWWGTTKFVIRSVAWRLALETGKSFIEEAWSGIFTWSILAVKGFVCVASGVAWYLAR